MKIKSMNYLSQLEAEKEKVSSLVTENKQVNIFKCELEYELQKVLK